MNRHGRFVYGPFSWSRNEWFLFLINIGGRSFGIYWHQFVGEITFIAGCQLVESSVLGNPRCFAGGMHLTLSISQAIEKLSARGRHGSAIRGTRSSANYRQMTFH